jgi:Zn ribbon nucleic-acid-binding protein
MAKCPTCDSERIVLYHEDYATVFKCFNCGELFDEAINSERDNY